MSRSSFRPLLTAWRFLTIIPLGHGHHDPSPAELARSMGWYPVIGCLIGGLLVLCDTVLSLAFEPMVENLLLLLILVGTTGALHQDGLADTLDGIAGGRKPAERLSIMRDPHIGAIGTIGLILDLALRYAGLVALPSSVRLSVLLCLPAVGRWAMVVGAWGTPYARAEGGLAAPFLRELTWRQVLGATAVLLAVVGWAVGPIGALLGCGLAALMARGVARSARALLGGTTGDVLGATNELVEILFLLTMPLLLMLR